ncbi:MAG: hypothetical protein ABIP95_06090 [Pelobium sp.]
MSTQDKSELEKKSPEGVEEDYTKHQEHPAPPVEAIEEKNEEGAGQAMKWIIPIVIAALFIVYFILKH